MVVTGFFAQTSTSLVTTDAQKAQQQSVCGKDVFDISWETNISENFFKCIYVLFCNFIGVKLLFKYKRNLA